jgi:hypothetical protein
MAFHALSRTPALPPPSDIGLSAAVVTIIVSLVSLLLAAVHAIPGSTVSGPRGGGPVIDSGDAGTTYIEYSAPEPAPTRPSWVLPRR